MISLPKIKRLSVIVLLAFAAVAATCFLIWKSIRENSLDAHARRISQTVDLSQLRGWADDIIHKYASETSSIAGWKQLSETPPNWIKRIPAPSNPWVVFFCPPQSGSAPYVTLVSSGSYRTYWMEIGRTNYDTEAAGHCIRLGQNVFFMESE